MAIFFDSSTLISLATTCNLHWLRELKKAYGGELFMTQSVKAETIERGLNSLRFKYEAIRLKSLVDSGVLKVYDENGISNSINNLMSLINNTYSVDSRPLNIVQIGEMTALAGCLKEDADALAVDERTTRLVVENPAALQELFTKKLHSRIDINSENLHNWENLVAGKLAIIRSAELAIVAWRKGLLFDKSVDSLAGILWALKFAGCAISETEIDLYTKKLIQSYGQ